MAAEGVEVRIGKDGTRTYRASVWSNRDRKRIRKTFAREAEAKAWRQDAAGAVRRGALRPSKPTTLRKVADEWLEGARAGIVRTRSGKTYKAASIRNYERTLRLHVLPVIGDRKAIDVRKVDVQDLVDRLVAQGLQPVTVQCDPAAPRDLRAARRPRRPRGQPDEQGQRAEGAARTRPHPHSEP